MAIWIDCIWILFDVVFCVYTEIELHPLTHTEWILAGFGLLFAVASLVAEFVEREAHTQEVNDIKLTLATGQATLSGKMDVIAMLGGETFHQLQAATQTRDKPVASVIEAAKVEIEELRAKVEAREQREWRLLSVEQENEITEAVRRSGREEVGQRSISIACSEFPDSFYLGEQLVSAFSKAGWNQSKNPSPDQIWAEIGPGITVRAPVGHPDANLIADTLAKVVGAGFVFRRNVESPLPAFYDLAFVVQIHIGRKPQRQRSLLS
ncbi:MAG TPA: hypothetical protein VMF50_02675 [Candidatus Binataceae bacterium]|nr:hypothetical protein [Candidatus Binataceae bacterium]